MPLKKVRNRDADIICESTKKRKAINKYTGLEVLKASRKSFGFTFLNTRYNDKPVTPTLSNSLIMLQIFCLSIKNSSNLIRFAVSPLKIRTHIDFGQNANSYKLNTT